MVGQIAARTKTIRVGSGGVMLSHYSAFKVAENFVCSIRCILGGFILGSVAHRGVTRALRQHSPIQAKPKTSIVFLNKLMTSSLISYSHDPSHPFASIRAAPTPTSTAPEVWLLGSGIDSAYMAAERGLPFSYAHFLVQAPKTARALPKRIANTSSPHSFFPNR